ncbi:hypothetical protein [Bradyrhizobium cajani]|uniref:Restriction endonuclease n=1 Tax=Bradyrhizobium cajani TaxID=1928661 RepID=A0A844T721_9BRAD|nr:hypothetical protein [Bradyrhizobium cajani]MCP3369774.1 hypothetical protein [Bradyrhizobium cajani]MVT74923.1 hypothetical protein [Bradyrhizobium cajani]
MFGLAHDESFVIMVWAIDAAQSGRAQAARRFLSFPKQVAEAKFGERYFVFKWALETLINELLSTKKKALPIGGPTRRLDCTKFSTVAACLNTLRNLEDAEDGIVLSQFTVFNIMHKIGHRQFEWQRGFFSYSQIYRNLTVFGGDLAADHFRSSYQLSIAEFFNCGFAFYALCQDTPGFKTGVNLAQVQLSDHARDRALRLLSAPLASVRKDASSFRQVDGKSTAYQRSVLRKTPILVFGDDVARAPLPSLILQRITSGLYYDLVGGGSRIWREIGTRFENYCVDLAVALLPKTQPAGSFKYKFTKNYDSPDLFLHDENGVANVIFECKAKKMSIAAKFSDDPFASAADAFSEIIKGVVQIWRFNSHCRRSPQIKAIHPESIGVVLTLDPWLQMSHQTDRVFDEARKLAAQIDANITEEDRRSVLFCSIDDFENTLERASEETLIEALRAAVTPEFRGWFLFNVHQQTTADDRRNAYPFGRRIAEIVPGWNAEALSASGSDDET